MMMINDDDNDAKECKRCIRTLKHYDFPPRRKVCRTCYTRQVAECHIRSGYKPPPPTLIQIRAWRILRQLRSDAEFFIPLLTKKLLLSVTSRQISAVITAEKLKMGRGVALLPRTLTSDFRIANLRLFSLDERRKLLQIITTTKAENVHQAYADATTDMMMDEAKDNQRCPSSSSV